MCSSERLTEARSSGRAYVGCFYLSLLIRRFRRAGSCSDTLEKSVRKASFGAHGKYVARTQMGACAEVLKITFIGRHYITIIETLHASLLRHMGEGTMFPSKGGELLFGKSNSTLCNHPTLPSQHQRRCHAPSFKTSGSSSQSDPTASPIRVLQDQP
jgi:hypothetical protein